MSVSMKHFLSLCPTPQHMVDAPWEFAQFILILAMLVLDFLHPAPMLGHVQCSVLWLGFCFQGPTVQWERLNRTKNAPIWAWHMPLRAACFMCACTQPYRTQWEHSALSLGWWVGDGKRRQGSWLPTESPTYLHFK